MDSEKRRKKLESAKEKLAAYQKRKAKKQLVEGQDAAARESAGTGASASDGATSDQEWASSDDDFDLEAGQSEGESMLPQEPQDRQAASPLHQEPHSPQLPQISLADTQKVAELQMALRQRDSLIQQLSAGLEGTAARLRSQQTQAAEFQLLTEQVSVLKGQVSQAEEKLKSQMEQQSASSLALQMAQEEILRLQHCLQEKATQLAEMTLQHSKQTAELRQVQASCLDHQTREVQLQFEFRELQQEHALMLRHAERERSAKAHQDSLSSQDCENLQRELDLLSQEHKNSLNELELLRGQNQDLEMKIVALEKRSSDALEGAGDNTGESLKRELQQLQSEHQVSLEELERLTQENTKFEQALKDLDQNHLSEELQQLQAEHQKSLEELRNLKGENSNLEKALKKLEEGNLNQELHQLQAEHRQSLEELGRLQKENNSLEQALKELEQDNLNFELHKLRAEHQVSLEELERLKQENTNLENALKNLEQDNVNLELQQLRTEHHASLEELGKLKEENTKLEQALKSLEDGNISQDLHLLQADHENSLEELKKLREENVNLEQALKALEQQQQHVGEDRELLETIRAELIELKQERTDYMSHLEDLKSQNDEANSQLTALDDTQRQLRLYKSESDELRSRINTQNSLIIKLKEDLQSCASDRDCLAQTISQEREKHEGELLQLQEEVQVLTQQVRNMVQMVGNLTAEAQTAKTSKEEMAAQLELITSHYRQILQENQVFPSANGTDLIKQVSAIPDAADPATVREVSSAVMESVPSPASADLNTSLNNTAQINLEGDHLAYESKIEALMAGAQILQEENARLQSRVKILQSELDSMHEAEQQRLAEVQGLQTQLTSLHSERNSLILQVDTWKEELGDSENQKAELLVQMETLQQQCQMLEQRLMEGQGGGAASPGSQAAEAQILLTKTADVHSTLSQSIPLEAAMESGQVLTYASSPLTSAPNVEAHVVSGTHAFTQTSEVATIDIATGDEPSLHLSDKEDASTQAEDTDENKSLLQEVERQKGLLEDLGEEKQALELQVETLQEKLLKMEETHSDLMTHFTQVEQEAHQLQERVSTSTDESERLRKELQQQTEHLSQVKDDLVRMQAEHTEKLNNAKRMLEEEHSTKLAAMSSDLEVAHTQARELQSALEETKSLHQTEEETMQQELQALQGENMRLREAALSESQERAEVEDLRLHYEGEMEKLCAEIHHLKMSNEAALSEYKEKIRLMEEEHQTYVHEKSEELNSVKKCLEDSLERVRTQELQIESLEQQMTILQADLDEKSENLVATNAALSAQDRTHQTRLASAMTELTAAERNLGDLQQKLTDVEMELEEKVKECADVQQQLQSAREELRSAQAHAEQQEMRLHSLQEELDLKQSMLSTSASETTQQVTSLEEALASARSEVAALQHRTSQLEADCLAAETCLERSQNEQEMKMKEMQDRITVLQDENLEANGLIQTLQEQAMADKAQFESDLLAVETAHKETCAEYQSQIQDLQERLGHLEEERDRANVTIQTLQDRLQVEKAQFEKDSKELERLLCLTEEDKHQVEINLQSANENLDRVIAEYRSDMEQMKKDIGQLREEKDQLEISGLQEQERIVAEYRQQASLLESKVSALEKEKKEKEDELQVQREENILALEENHQTVKELEERVASLQREKETLKTNFDSCMVEMQQQIHQQETEILSLQSYRAEHAQISERSQEELKMAFEIQVADLEEKLKQAEGDLALLQPQLEALQTEKQELRDQLDSQVPALESNCLALEQEVSKLRQELTATTDAHHKERNQESKNHAAAMADMEETVRQLEEDKSRMESQVVELQRQQAAEKDRMSQSFEQQFAEQDERAHYLEQETSRLRKHLEEMAADHKQEKAELQKLYESQIIDLEDRLAQANANLNVVTKQKRMAEESLAENKAAAEQQVQQLETRCRELQKAYHEAADRLMQTSDLSHQEREQLEATYDASLSAEQEQNAALREKVQQLEGEIVVARRAHREEVEQLQQEVTAASSRADSGPSADLLQELEELKSKVQLMEQVEADRARQLREAPHELNEPHSASSQGPIVDEARALSAQMSGHISSEASLQSALDLAKSEIKDLKETVKGLSEEKQRLTADLLALQKRPEPSPAAPDASSVEDDFDADSLNGSEDGPPGSRQATPSDSGNSNTNATVSGLEAEQAAETDPLGMLCAQIDDLTKLTSVLEARVATLEQECAELTSEKTDLMAENASLVAKLQLASKELPSSADIEAAPVPATLVYEPTQQPTEVEGDWENEGRLEDSSQDLCDRDAHMEMSTNNADMKNTNLSLMELNESLTEEISTLRDEVSSLTAEMSNLQSENSVLLQHNTQLAAWKDQESEGDRTHLHILMAEVVALREQAVSLNSLTKTVKGPRATMKYSPAWMTEGDQTLQLADLEVEREHHAVDTSSTLVESDGQDHGELQTLGVESTLATHDLNEEASESVTETSEEGQVRSTLDQSRKTLLQLVDANRRFRGLALSLAGARATTSASVSDTGDEDGQKKLPSPSESEVTVATGIADELALLVSFYELKVSELTKELGILQQDYAYLHRCRQSDVSSLQAQLLGDLTLSEGIFQPEGHSNLSEEMQSAPQTGSDEWPAPLLEQPAHARGSFEGVDSREGHFQSVERTAHDRVEVATQTSPIEDVGVDKFPAEDQDLSLEKSRVLASSKAIAAQARVPATTAQDSLDKEEVAGAPERVTEHPTVSSGSSPLGSLHANVLVTPEPCMTASESEVVVDEIHKTPPVVASASSLHTAGRSVDAATSSSTLQSASLVNCVDKSSQTEASNDLTPVEEKGPDGLSHEEEMEAMREQLLWEKVEALRNLEAQLAVEKKNAIEEECRRMEQQLKQQLKAFQQKQHQSFIKAYQQTKKKLQQAYKDKLKEKISALKSEMSQVTELPGPQDAAAVERLHKENQELAEARDELLHQVEISSSRTALLQQQLENVMQLQEHPYPGASADRDWASVSSDTFSDRDLVEELELLSQQSQEVGPPLEYQLSFSPETRRSSGFLKVAEDEPASQATTGHGSGFLSSENEDDLSVNPRQRGSRDVSPQPSESLRGETSGGLGSRSPRHASTGGCGQEECSRLKQDYINLLDAFQRLQSGGTLIAQDSVFVPSEDEPVETLPEMQASASSLHGSSSQGEFVPSNMGSQDQDLDTTDRAVDSASETGHEEQDPLETTNQDQQTHTPSMSEQAGRTGERSVFFESVCFSKRKIFKSDMEAVPFGKRDEIEEAVLESKADDRPEGSFIAAEPELMGHFDEEDSDEQDGQVLMGRLVVDRSVVAGSAEGTFTDPTLPSEDGAELLQQLANLESDRRLSEDSLAHQLELFSAENQQLQKKCETLQSQLDTATEARLSLEDQLATHNSLLSTALHQARAEKEAAEESELEKFHLEDLEAQMREISLTLAGRQMQISRLQRDIDGKDEPQLEGLKAQYEEQVAALQQQVSAMQNHQADRVPPDLHARLQEAVEALRQKLGEDHRQMLDQLLAELDSQFQEQISQLKAQHAEEVTLQVQAMKIASEQVHQSHLRLVQGELEARHQEELAETQARLLQQLQEQPSLQQFANMSQTWENQYAELTQRLGRDLDTRLTQMLQALQDGSSSESQSQESSASALPASVQEIQQLLSSQQEEMTALRSRCLAEFEESLRVRSDNMMEQSAEVAALQAEIDTLQQQYQHLLKEKQAASSGDPGEQAEDPEVLRKALAELKAYYEKRVETIEQTFEEEIAQLKAKYEADMTAAHGEGTDVDSVPLVSSLAMTQERDYKVQAPLVSAVLSEDSHEEEDGPAAESHVRELEQAVVEKDHQIQELERQLEEERSRVGSLEAACKEDKERLNTALAQLQELKQSAEKELPSQSSSDTVAEKDSELEKYRSELSEKDQHIAELVDMESFLLKENEQLKQQVSDLEAQLKELTESDSNRGEADENESVKELEAMVAQKQEACEKFVKDLEEREKELEVLRSESESFQELKQQWQQKESDWLSEKDKFSAQVEELSEKHKELQARLDDVEHRHQEQMEAVRQELEHERQVEVETLQSEFKVQLEIELKRQAVELSSNTSSTQLGQLDEGDSVDSKETPGHAAGEEDGTSVDAALAAAEAERQEDALQSEDLPDSGDLLTQYQARITELEKELKDLQNRHTSLLSGEGPEIEQLLKERYDNELELAKSFQQSEFDDMLKAEKKKTLERHRSLMDGFVKEKQEEMEQLKAEHERELEETRASLLQEYEEKMRTLTQQQAELQTAESSSSEQTEELSLIQQQLQTEVQSLQQMLGEKEQELETKEQEISDKLKELEALHQHKLLQVAQDCESRMAEARHELETAHREEVARVKEAVKTELETAHQEELERQLQQLESKHSKELANLQQQQHQSTLEQLQQEHQSALEQLQQEHQSAVEQLQQEHQSTVEQLQQEHQSAVEQLQASHQAELQKVEEMRGAAQSQGMLSEVTEISMPVATVQQTVAAPEEHLPVWSTPRPGSSETVTRSFAQVVSGIPPIPQTSASSSGTPTSPPTSTSRAETPTPDGKVEEEKDRIIERLQAEVVALTQRLERSAAHRASPGGQEVGGGDNLLSMLRADLETTGSEREVLHRANDRLLQLLSNAVKTYMSVEDGINRRLARIVSHGSRAGRPPSAEPSSRHSPPVDGAEPRDAECSTPTPHCEGAEGGDSQDTTLEETSILSSATDEGLDVSQRLVESLFLGPDLDAEGEELVQDAQERLQRAVSQLLDMMERTTQQLIEAQRYQEEILASLETSHQDLQAEKSRAEEGEDRLRDESSAKEYLAQELHKAEGLISGYTVEREEMEGRLQRLEEEREVMAGELERLRSKLSDLEEDQQSLQAQRQALQRQQSLLQQNAGTENQGTEPQALDMTSGGQALLGELSKMTEVRHQLQQQLKHQAERSQASLRELESISEEQQQRMEKELEAQRAEIADLKLQLDNTERQLKAKKQFIDEQSAEREQEREEFQREMDQMKERLASFDRRGNAEGRLQQEVEDLTEQLESRMQGHNEMQQRTEQMQRELQERERTEEELKLSVAQLEKELEDKATAETQLQQRIQRLEEQLVGHVSELETSDPGMSPPTKEQRGSPRMLSPERQRLPRNLLSLQDELLRARRLEEELQQEKELLQQQVQEQMLQISALRNQLDDLKHWGTDPVTSSSHLADLRQQLQSLRDQLEKRDQEVGMMEEEKEKLKEKLSLQEAEMDTFREAIKSGNMAEAAQVDTLTQERDRLQHEVETLREQLADKEMQGGEAHSQQSSLSGDYSLTDRDPRLLNVSMTQRTNFQQELEQTVAEREAALAELELEAEGSRRQLAELQTQLTDVQAQLAKAQEESEARQEQLSEKETAVEQLQEQVESLQQEVSSLTTFQNELQKDFDEVQAMLEEKQRQMEGLTRELADSRLSTEAPDPELVVKLEREIVALKKELQEKLNIINEKEEEMYVLNEKLEQQESMSEALKTVQEERDLAQAGLQEATQELEQLKEQLQELASSSHRAEEEQDGALQMELYATQEEKRLLEEELEEKDRLLGMKETELEDLRNRVKEGKEMTEEPNEEEEVRKQRRDGNADTEASQQELAKQLASLIQDFLSDQTTVDAPQFSADLQQKVDAIADTVYVMKQAENQMSIQLKSAQARCAEAERRAAQAGEAHQELAAKLGLVEKQYNETAAKLNIAQQELQDFAIRLNISETKNTLESESRKPLPEVTVEAGLQSLEGSEREEDEQFFSLQSFTVNQGEASPDISISNYDDVTTAASSAQELSGSLSAEKADLQAEVTPAQQGLLETLSARLSQAERHSRDLTAKNVALESELQKTRAKLKITEARHPGLGSVSSETSSPMVSAFLSLPEPMTAEVVAMAGTARARLQLAETKLESVESQLEAALKDLSDAQTLAQEKAVELKLAQMKVKNLSASAAQLEEEKTALKDELSSVEVERERLSEEVEDLRSRVRQLEQHLAEREEQLQQLQQLQGSSSVWSEEAGTEDELPSRSKERWSGRPLALQASFASLSSLSLSEGRGGILSSHESIAEDVASGGEASLGEVKHDSRKLDGLMSRQQSERGSSSLSRQGKLLTERRRVFSAERLDEGDAHWRSDEAFNMELEEEESQRVLSSTVELGNIRRHTSPAHAATARSLGGGSLWRSESEPRLGRSSPNARLLAQLQHIDSASRSQRWELAAKNRELAAIRSQLELWIKSGNSSASVSALRVALQETKVRAELLERRLTERDREIGTLKSQLEAAKSAASSSRAKDSASHQEVLELQSRLQNAQDTITQLRLSRRLELPRAEEEEEQEEVERLPTDVATLQEQLQHLREELDLFRSTASMSAADFVKKVMELRRELSEAHQEQIRDVQTRFADEEEARLSMLQQRHQLELDQQEKVWERRLATTVAQECQTLEQQHNASMVQMRQQHQQEIDTLLRSRTASVEEAVVMERLQARLPDREHHHSALLQQAGSSSPDNNDASVSDISSLDLTGDESVSSRLQMLLERLHRDGLHLLTLSELQFLRRHLSPEKQPHIGDVDAVMAAWERERQTQVSTINSLKELLSQAHRASIGDRGQELEGDWRGELLKALCNVFGSEREKLLAELRTLLSSQSADSKSALDILEKRVHDQETLHREALQQLLAADRQSLLEEVRELRSAGSGGRQQQQQELSQLQDKLAEVEDAAQQKEWQLQRKVQVLEYKLQQETVIEEDLKASLAAEQGRVAQLNQQVGREKERSLELQTELTSAQIQTAKARDALEREQNRFTNVSDALEEAKEERVRLLELLEMERKRRHSHSQETTLQHSQQEANARFIKELSAELERERVHSSDLARQLEMQNTRYSTLEQELEAQARLAQRASAELTNQITQLQQALNSETERTAELERALERERQLRQSKEQEEVDLGQSELSIADLRSQLVAEQALVTDLQTALARERSQTSSAKQHLEEERKTAQQALQEQQSASRHLASRLEAVQRELLQAQEQRERQAWESASSLREQEGRLRTLEAAVKRHQEEEQRLQKEAAASTRRQRQQDNTLEELKVKVHNYELDIERLNKRSRELLAQRENARDGAEEDADVQQHLALSKRHLESILQRLEHVTVQLQQLPLAAGEHTPPESSQLQQQLDNILTEVRQLQRPVTGQEAQRSAQAVLGSFINERVLQHNAELNSYIAVLCREKEELRNTNTQLEQQIEAGRTGRRCSLQGEAEGSSADSEEEMLRQRAMWASEKLTLQMALDSAEREVEHLQTELRHFRQQLDSENLLANPKRDKMNKLYGKYLRAESYRRALIYQKRYLLQLLGGFEDCERETLDIIAAMGAHPNAHEVQQRQSRFARPLNRFRAAAYSCIAVSRLRYLVRKWRRATRVGSPVITGRLDVNTGYVPTAGSFSPPTSPPRTARSQPPGPPPRPSLVAYSREMERASLTQHSNQLHSNQIHSSHHSSQLHSRSLHSHSAPSQHSQSLSSAPAYSQLPLEELSQESLDGSRHESYHYTASGGAAFLPPASSLASRGAEFEHGSSRGFGGRDGGYDYETGYGTEQARLRSYPSTVQGGERSARQQANGSSSAASSSFSSGGLRFSTPPTRERSSPRDLRSPAVGSARRRILQDFEGNARPSNRTRESHNDEFIQRLENLQHRLSGYSPRDHSRSKQRHTLSLH